MPTFQIQIKSKAGLRMDWKTSTCGFCLHEICKKFSWTLHLLPLLEPLSKKNIRETNECTVFIFSFYISTYIKARDIIKYCYKHLTGLDKAVVWRKNSCINRDLAKQGSHWYLVSIGLLQLSNDSSMTVSEACRDCSQSTSVLLLLLFFLTWNRVHTKGK